MRNDPFDLLWLFGLSLVTLAAVVILVVTALWIRSRWFENEDPAGSAGKLLLEYREMLQRGELTDEEYRLIKSRLTARTGGNLLSPLETGTREAGTPSQSPESNPKG